MYKKSVYHLAGFVCSALASLPFLFASCSSGGGSGGSGGSVDALSLPSRIELTKVDSGSTSQSKITSNSGFNDPGTDYSNTTKHSYVKDTDALEIINDLLGVMHDTGYQYFVTQGPYRALVEPVGKGQESQGGSSATSTNVESLQEMIVDVTRADNNSPMIVKVWSFETSGPNDQPMLVKAYFEVSRGVSTEYPYGELEAHIAGYPLDSNGNPQSTRLFTLALSITSSDGQVVVESVEEFEEEDPESGDTIVSEHKVRVLADSNLETGKAYAFAREENTSNGLSNQTVSYFAFNQDYFKVKEMDSSSAVVYRKHDLIHRVYNYKLFDADTGSEVTLTSGYPIKFSNGRFGYIGYYGLWSPTGVTVTNGEEVTRMGTGETYTIFGVRGKLTKHSKATVPLGDITNVEIYVWNGQSQQDDVVIWDGTGFKKIGTRSRDGTVTYIDPYQDYSFSDPWSGGWCDALHAWLPLGNLTNPSNSSTISYHLEEVVNPSSAQNLTLYFWGFALDFPVTQDAVNNAQNARDNYWQNGPTKKTYYFDAANMVLKENDADGDEVIIPSSISLSNSIYSDGYFMGPLTTNNSYTSSNWSEVYNENTYYYWSTGPNTWNQYWTVKDSNGQYAVFDPPIRFTYTHTTENDINGDSTYNNKKFSLEYDGSNLNIPGKYDENEGEWIPIFSLKDGTVLTPSSNSEVQYVVKGTEESLVMSQETDQSVISALETTLPIDTSIPEPTIQFDSSKNALVGDPPQNAELKVIKGELIPSSG